MPEITKIVPLDEALAAVDSPTGVAAYEKEAEKMAKELEGPARGYMFALAPPADIDTIRAPFHADPHTQLYGAKLHAAELAAGRAADAVVLKQCKIAARARAVAAVYNDPDRQEAERVWQQYAKGVTAVAWAQGNKEAGFIRRWRELIDARHDAEEYGDAGAIRSIDARLLRLVGIPYPQLPEAAWIAADTLPMSEQPEEMARLEQKYGPRDPSANGSGKTSRRRLTTRPMSALTTTR